MSENVINSRVVRGFHGLHQYANEYWFQHLLLYAKQEHVAEDEDLEGLLEELEEFWKGEPGTGAKRLRLDDNTARKGIESQLQVLTTMPQAQCMGRDILTFRRFISQEKYSHKKPECKQAETFNLDIC
jgi:hypothetical protein